jgi:tRNA G18 (ribose-2'-O)-methylase SpoU
MPLTNKETPKNWIVLDNIRSSWNVGSIMRSCDGLGFGLILVGYTPRPIGATLKVIIKTSIGAEKTVPWQAFDNWNEVLEAFPIGQNQHVAIEISDTSQNLFEYLPRLKTENKKTFFWFGNEIHGLQNDLMETIQNQLHLPMNGNKESLNIANCVCTVGYLWLFINSLQ